MRKFLMIITAFFFILSSAEGQLPKPKSSRYKPVDPWRKSLVSAATSRYLGFRKYDFSAGFGSTQFFGDIGGFSRNINLLGFKDFSFLNTGFNFNTSLKIRIQDNLTARLNLAFGSFRATDVRGSNEIRGIETATLFFEPALIGEYYFIKQRGYSSYLYIRGIRNFSRSFFSTIDCYVFTGLGGIAYNAKLTNTIIPSETKKSGFAPVIPAGVGVNLLFTRDINFGLELGGRYAFSDYIEGYTSAYSKSNDIYYFMNLTFTYKLKTGKKGWPTF
ncbi:MAG: hypothetical protein C0408_09095 [Odoribacter sp.]|nr:hypothetical protein [Odoribacter sp.]